MHVPEQDLLYRIRSITEAERQHYRRILCRDDDPDHNQLALVVFCIVDEAGQRLFEDGDVAGLAQIDSAITTRLYQACLEHCTYEEGPPGNSGRTPAAASR